jgi:hypothetical protein
MVKSLANYIEKHLVETKVKHLEPTKRQAAKRTSNNFSLAIRFIFPKLDNDLSFSLLL